MPKKDNLYAVDDEYLNSAELKERRNLMFKPPLRPTIIFQESVAIKPRGVPTGTSFYDSMTSDEWMEKIHDYIASCGDGIMEYDNGEDMVKPIVKKFVKIPTIDGFCLSVGMKTDLFYTYMRGGKPEFEYAYDTIMGIQKTELINKSLSGEYNATIAKMLLSVHHGISDDTDQAQLALKNNSLTIQFVGGPVQQEEEQKSEVVEEYEIPEDFKLETKFV